MIRTYKELVRFDTFEDRFNYLRLDGVVGLDTFGFDRYLNQDFYKSKEWKRIRDYVITRDLGRDLGVPGFEIKTKIIIHHMNPISADDIIHSTDFLIDPEYLITTRLSTHNAIHYGTEGPIEPVLIERKPNDTCPWRH